MKNTSTRRGFTLIELLVVVLIVGILTAVAVSQYQKAVYKSRFSAMMPVAKTIANANEVYYTENGRYASTPAQLSVSAQENAEDGTGITLYSNPEELSFVLAHNDNIPNIRYVVYQKFSANFPDTAWCEAGDEKAEALCVSLGGIIPEGVTGNSSGQEDNWKAYLLSGQARAGDTFASTGGGDDNNGEGEGSANTDTPTIAKMSAEEAQNIANEKCANPSYGCVGIANDDGTVSVCENRFAGVNEETNECVVTGLYNFYENVYDANGKLKEKYGCNEMNDDGMCVKGVTAVYDSDGTGTFKRRKCSNGSTLSKEAACSNNEYDMSDTMNNYDHIYPPEGGQATGEYICSTINSTGDCTAYSKMTNTDWTYASKPYTYAGLTNYVQKECVSISQNNPTTCENNNYKPVKTAYNTGSYWRAIQCYNDSGNATTGNTDGTCPSGYSWKQQTGSSGNIYIPCTSYESINWETATCN